MTNDLLEELLNIEENDIDTIEEENTKLSPLLLEINLIFDESIKNFVRAMLFRAESFWKAPSTNTTGYHPPDELKIGGNIIHTKRVVRIARTMCSSQERTQHDLDIITAAALIHDVTKGIEVNGEFNFDSMHPYTVDHFVAVVMSNEEKNTNNEKRSYNPISIDMEDCATILRLVRCHLGPWSPIPETFPITLMEWIMHFADVIATQLHTIIDGEEIESWRWIEPEPRSGTEIFEENLSSESDVIDFEGIDLPSQL